jgi:tRNA threonylcarbamoyladenosine biosynthesis protein TsaE
MIRLRSRSPEETEAVASTVAVLCRPGDIVVLAGGLGAGKTTFARGFAAGLGVGAHEPVASPTFGLVHVHDSGRIPLAHADLYRLGSMAELDDLGLRETADLGSVVLVEWGDVVEDRLGDVLCVDLGTVTEDSVREIAVSVRGARWESRWSRLVTALGDWTVR